MQRFTSKQRKFIYLGAIIVLLFPVVFLGMPSSPDRAGGQIARMRAEYSLGETAIGDVDPTSSTMNLMLLGLRGVAANVLWMNADDQKKRKDWTQLEQTVNTIIKLQPHFEQVWKFQSWNLAYNVSAEFDAIPDRYFWVKKGAKFLKRGTERNQDSAVLYHDLGDFLGKKVGRSDEWRLFRGYFRDQDPDVDTWGGGPDLDLNPEQKDNYLVAKDVFKVANEKEELPDVTQRKMARVIFRSYPVRSQLDYAYALQREGKFDEVDTIARAWGQGNDEWMDEYGREEFRHSFGGKVILNWNEDDLKTLAEEDNMSEEEKQKFIESVRKMVNYKYWGDRSAVESESKMIEARRLLYSGKDKLLNELDLVNARKELETGLKLLDEVINNPEDDRGRMMTQEAEVAEDIVKSLIMWQYILRLDGEEVSDDFVLKEVWDANGELVQRFTSAFQQRIGAADQ